MTYFFDDIPQDLIAVPAFNPNGFAGGYTKVQPEPAIGIGIGIGIDDKVRGGETLELVSAYYRINDPMIRKVVFNLIKSLGQTD